MSDDTPTQRFPERSGDTPTQRLDTGEVQEDLQEEKQKSKGLLIGLVVAGGLLLLAIVVIAFFLLTRVRASRPSPAPTLRGQRQLLSDAWSERDAVRDPRRRRNPPRPKSLRRTPAAGRQEPHSDVQPDQERELLAEEGRTTPLTLRDQDQLGDRPRRCRVDRHGTSDAANSQT